MTKRSFVLAALTTLVTSMVVLAAPASPALADFGCGGKTITIYAPPGGGTVHGTSGDDVIGMPYLPDSDSYTIYGMGGNDTICTDQGNDVIYGGAGNDTIYAGPGSDQLYGGPGHDTLNGGKGPDYLNGGKGNDVCNGGPGHDNSEYCESETSIP
jgi:Ca2+-binding RTX toxin-like protein